MESDAGGAPFGAAELVDAVAGCRRVLDVGCGSGRLAVTLAERGHEVTALERDPAALARTAERARAAGATVATCEADVRLPLPLAAASFDAAVSRLVLMIPPDPAAALRGVVRCLRPGATVATAVWAHAPDNPWFCEPRAAVADALGAEPARFARVFGRLGSPDELAAVHRAAGLVVREARILREHVAAADAAEHWAALVRQNGHYRRLDAALSGVERERVLSALARRLALHRDGETLRLARTLVLVSATVP